MHYSIRKHSAGIAELIALSGLAYRVEARACIRYPSYSPDGEVPLSWVTVWLANAHRIGEEPDVLEKQDMEGRPMRRVSLGQAPPIAIQVSSTACHEGEKGTPWVRNSAS
jgi:hypothetical protein